MRLVKSWLAALFVLLAMLAPASALPVPKLPPEVTNKPSVVIRVRPLVELMKDVNYVAKMLGQDGVLGAVEPIIQPVLDAMDATKPIGFYGIIGPKGIDSKGVLLLPVKNQESILNLLKTFGQNPVEGEGGLYTVNAPGVPQVLFRYTNGYLYSTVKHVPDADAILAPNKLYAPEALFKQGDDSLFSVTLNVDAVPNDLKRMAFAHLEEGLKYLRTNEFSKENNPVVRTFLETAAEEVGAKLQGLVVDAQSMALRFDFDRTKEEMGFSARLTPRPSTDLANDIATISSGKSLGAGIISPNSTASIFANIAVPTTLKKALDPVIDELVANGWKKAKGDEQPYVKELLEILAPTLKAGILDFGADFRGPNADKNFTAIVTVNVKDADRLEALGRKAYAILPAGPEKAAIKLDVDKAGGIALHQLPQKADPQAQQIFGPNYQMIVAFRKDAIVFGIGQPSDAATAVKGSLTTTAKSGPVVEGTVSMRGMGTMMERKEAAFGTAVKKAYPAGVNDAYRFTVNGGQNLDLRISTSTRLLQLGMEIEQARRNR